MDACVNTHCRDCGVVLFLQNEIPPYESRITTAKLLIESEEYEVKMLCVVLVYSEAVGSLCASWWEGGLAFVCVCAHAFVCFPF